ncbi:MAG: DUF805 domain-containing protein [Muribaculaceae bacterium]|nr:DUF805 domain-containing protein [Muribaculaceae bacterium]
MNLSTSFKTCAFHKYADFKGEASRSEYWWFWLIYEFIVFGLPIISFILDDYSNFMSYSLLFIWIIGTFGLTCPFIAVSIRRLHDSGLSGWHFLWRGIPYVGFIITTVLMCRKSVNTESTM